MSRCALVITGGNSPEDLSQLQSLPPYSYTCAADSGLDTANKLKIPVDFAIGDFDSIQEHKLLSSVNHIQLPTKKDDSDTEALLKHLIREGFDEYILVGGGEGRFDHLMNLYSLFSQYHPPLQWITAKEKLVRVDTTLSLHLPLHSTISVLRATSLGTSYVTCPQLTWPLDNFLIDSTHMSLSNETISPTISITITGNPIFICINNIV